MIFLILPFFLFLLVFLKAKTGMALFVVSTLGLYAFLFLRLIAVKTLSLIYAATAPFTLWFFSIGVFMATAKGPPLNFSLFLQMGTEYDREIKLYREKYVDFLNKLVAPVFIVLGFLIQFAFVYLVWYYDSFNIYITEIGNIRGFYLAIEMSYFQFFLDMTVGFAIWSKTVNGGALSISLQLAFTRVIVFAFLFMAPENDPGRYSFLAVSFGFVLSSMYIGAKGINAQYPQASFTSLLAAKFSNTETVRGKPERARMGFYVSCFCYGCFNLLCYLETGESKNDQGEMVTHGYISSFFNPNNRTTVSPFFRSIPVISGYSRSEPPLEIDLNYGVSFDNCTTVTNISTSDIKRPYECDNANRWTVSYCDCGADRTGAAPIFTMVFYNDTACSTELQSVNISNDECYANFDASSMPDIEYSFHLNTCPCRQSNKRLTLHVISSVKRYYIGVICVSFVMAFVSFYAAARKWKTDNSKFTPGTKNLLIVYVLVGGISSTAVYFLLESQMIFVSCIYVILSIPCNLFFYSLLAQDSFYFNSYIRDQGINYDIERKKRLKLIKDELHPKAEVMSEHDFLNDMNPNKCLNARKQKITPLGRRPKYNFTWILKSFQACFKGHHSRADYQRMTTLFLSGLLGLIYAVVLIQLDRDLEEAGLNPACLACCESSRCDNWQILPNCTLGPDYRESCISKDYFGYISLSILLYLLLTVSVDFFCFSFSPPFVHCLKVTCLFTDHHVFKLYRNL
jgi:hypothetical protein